MNKKEELETTRTSWKITGIIADNYLGDATMYAAPGTLSDVCRRIEDLTGIPQYLAGSLYWSAPSIEDRKSVV